jgi:Protoglobin
VRADAGRALAAPTGKETHAMSPTSIPGYAYGTPDLPRSPVTLQDLDTMKKTVLFGEEDVEYLQMSYDVLADQVEDVLDVWYGFLASNPHLAATFASKKDGKPIGSYLTAVRRRFGRWILDTAAARFDQAWLDWQEEIGLRHHRAKKNATDGVDAAEIVKMSHLVLLVFPVTATLRPFLARKGHPPAEVDKMHAAWTKAVLLQVALWCRPYVKEGDY